MSDHVMVRFARWSHDVLMEADPVLLIVDDNAAVRSALGAYMLRVAGWATVLIAEDAARALEIAADLCPDAIVLDNFMPGGNGIDVLPDLRRACPAARIVMHTTDDSPELRDAASARGADAVVHKGRPLDELALLLDAA